MPQYNNFSEAEIIQNYKRINNPTCNLDIYLKHWKYEELLQNEITSNFKDTRNIADSYKKFLHSINKEKVTDNMKNSFIYLINSRNKYSVSKGYSNYVELILNEFNIPEQDYNLFNKRFSKEIPRTHKEKCLICTMNNFPFGSFDEVISFVLNADLIKKVIIKNGDYSDVKYLKESDQFEITINNSLKFKHQCLHLLHELCHINFFIECFDKKILFIKLGKYKNELEALKKEAKLLVSISDDLYKFKKNDSLNIAKNTFMESQLYLNPKTSILSKEYFYDKQYYLRPLNRMAHSVAYSNLF